MLNKIFKNKFTEAQRKKIWFYIISLLFVVINAIAIYKENYFVSLVPIVLLLVFIAFFALDKFILLIVFCAPLSLMLNEFFPHSPVNMYLPTEPLLFGVLILFILKLLSDGKFDRRIAFHPVSLIIYFQLIWMFITTLTSTMPVVSLKFFLSRLWFVVSFYFIATQLFRNYKYIKRYIWAFVIPMLIVIFYTISHHLHYGLFDHHAAHFVMQPFFKDHTSYGAILAMYLPLIIGFATRSKYPANGKILIWLIGIVFSVAIVLSYTRAAWVSLLGALVMLLLIIFRIKLSTILVIATIIISVLLSYRVEIMIQLEQNRTVSSADLEEHVKSISNIATDASNMERINRWMSALRMFEEKPILGWGPGTYQFQYAPFQNSQELTIISTNAGDMGNAHSEYIGPLAEQGVLGSLAFILLAIAAIYYGVRLYFRFEDTEMRMIILTSFLGLVTYFIHGFLNNYLDTDKASVPFWGFLAMLVAFDVYHSKPENINEDSNNYFLSENKTF